MKSVFLYSTIAFIFITVVFFSWNTGFQDNEYIHQLGLILFQIFLACNAIFWVALSYKNNFHRYKKFWLILLIGLCFYTTGDISWMLLIIMDSSPQFTDLSSLFWLMGYLFYIVSIIFILKAIKTNIMDRSILFNIAIYVITVSSILYYYLMHPIFIQFNNSLGEQLVTVSFQIFAVGMFFLLNVLGYHIRTKKEHPIFMILVVAFVLQISGDSIYAYYTINYLPSDGILSDLFWFYAMAGFGLAGYYGRKKMEKPTDEHIQLSERKELLFPFISVVALIILVMFSYEWQLNGLSIGLILIFILIFARQLGIIFKNEELTKEYKHLAYHDALTGLLNRRSFNESIENALSSNTLNAGIVILIDLDRFKMINDTLGHYVGDAVLSKTGALISSAVGENSYAYRIGGDEFAVLTPNASQSDARKIASNILKKFEQPLNINEQEIFLTPSLGISLFPDHGTSSEELVKSADAALYLSKDNGKNNYNFFNDELNASMARRMLIETELRKAITNKQFTLHYQPKINMRSNQLVGLEALLRWDHPHLGKVSPVEFIPVAEDSYQINAIGRWVIEEACLQMKKWEQKGYILLPLSVNVSTLQLRSNKFLSFIESTLRKSGISPGLLELEITESIVQNLNESTKILSKIRKMGIEISIDDFGTGYSSLNILQRLPIDTLKIDKSFIDDIDKPAKHSMVKTIIDLGINMNLKIVAEGIEEAYQKDYLLRNGCEIGQGYLFSKPLSPEDTDLLLKTGNDKDQRAHIL